MRAIILSLVILAMVLAFPSAQAITISSDVTFQAGPDLTAYWDSTSTLSSITVKNGSISFNGFELGASDTVNVTILAWSLPRTVRPEFRFRANSTPGTSVDFTLVSAVTAGSWTVDVDGVWYASGSTPVLFTISDWQADVNRFIVLFVSFVGEAESWLIEFGPMWISLLIGAGIFGLIFISFKKGIGKRKRTGKIWKYMPRKFR